MGSHPGHPGRERNFPPGSVIDRNVTSERKIWEAAMLLISRHGIQAIAVAENEACRHQRQSDVLSANIWRWILRDVYELLRPEPEGSERVH